MRSSYGRGIVAELRSEVITSEDYADGYEVLGCRVTFVFRTQANETCANRTYKGLFTKPPIHWRMKPLEYVSPDLFNLCLAGRVWMARLYLILCACGTLLLSIGEATWI